MNHVLVADDIIDNAEFGKSVAINGNYAVIGSPKHHENNEGRAYIYQRNVDTDGNVSWTNDLS